MLCQRQCRQDVMQRRTTSINKSKSAHTPTLCVPCFGALSLSFSLSKGPLRWMWTKDCEFWKEHLDATFVWDAAEALAAAALLAKEHVLGEQAKERGGPRRRERQGSSAYIALTHTDDTPTAVHWRDETRKRQESARVHERAGTPWEIGCARTQGQRT